jgi:dienelactone hydrolase
VRTRRLVLAALVLVAAACSSESSSSSPTEAVESSTAAPTTAATTAPVTIASTAAPTTAATTAPPTTVPVDIGEAKVSATQAGDYAAFAERGPYDVVADEVEVNGRPVTVWIPVIEGSGPPATYDLRLFLPEAERPKVADAESSIFIQQALTNGELAPGPHPVVLFSHGFAGYRHQSTFLTTHLASWGMVVASPQHPSRDLTAVLTGATDPQDDVTDLSSTLDWLLSESPYSDELDATRISVVGHSAGGGAAIRLSASDDRVGSYVSLTTGIRDPADAAGLADKPSLFMLGTADVIIPPESPRNAFAAAPTPTYLVELDNVTHVGFMDFCTQRDADGRDPLQLAQTAGVVVPDVILRLVADGCDASHTAADLAWPPINTATTAFLMNQFIEEAAPLDAMQFVVPTAEFPIVTQERVS